MTIYNNLYSKYLTNQNEFQLVNEENELQFIDSKLRTTNCDLVELNQSISELDHRISELNRTNPLPEWLIRLRSCKEELNRLISNPVPSPSTTKINVQNIKDDEDLKNIILQIEKVLNSPIAAQVAPMVSLRIEKIEEYLGGKIEKFFTIQRLQEQFEQLKIQFSQYDIKRLYGRVTDVEKNIQLLFKKLNNYIDILNEGKSIAEFDSQKLEEELETYQAEIQSIFKYKAIPCINNLFNSIHFLKNRIGNDFINSNTEIQQDFNLESFLKEIQLLNKVFDSEIWKRNRTEALKVNLQKRVRNLNNYLGREGSFPEIGLLLTQINEIRTLITKASILNKDNSVPVDYPQLEGVLFSQPQNPKFKSIIARYLGNQSPFQKFFPEMVRYNLCNNTFIKPNLSTKLDTIIKSNTEYLNIENIPDKSLNQIKQTVSAEINKFLNEEDLQSIENREELYQILEKKLKDKLCLSQELLNLMIPTSEILDSSNMRNLAEMANDAIFLFYSMLEPKDKKNLQYILTTLFVTTSWFSDALPNRTFAVNILPSGYLAFIILELQTHYNEELSFASTLKILSLFKGMPESVCKNFYNRFIEKQNSCCFPELQEHLPDHFKKINDLLFQVRSQSQSPEFQEYLKSLFVKQIFETEYFRKLFDEKLINATKDKITSVLNEVDFLSTPPDKIKQYLLENSSLTKMNKDIFIEALKQISNNLINNHPFFHLDSFNWQKLFENLCEAPKKISASSRINHPIDRIISIASSFSNYSSDKWDPQYSFFYKSTISQFSLNEFSENLVLNPLLKAKICNEILIDLDCEETQTQIINWIERAQLWIESYNFPGKPLSAVFDFIRKNPSSLELAYLPLFLNSDTFIHFQKYLKYKKELEYLINLHENVLLKNVLHDLSKDFMQYREQIISLLRLELSSKNKQPLKCSPKEIYHETKKEIKKFSSCFKRFFNCDDPKTLTAHLPKEESILVEFPASYFDQKLKNSFSLFLENTLRSFNMFGEEKEEVNRVFTSCFSILSQPLNLKQKCKKFESIISLFNSLRCMPLKNIRKALINFETVSSSLESINSFIDDDSRTQSVELKKIAYIFIDFISYFKLRSKCVDRGYDENENWLNYIFNKTGLSNGKSFFSKYSIDRLKTFLDSTNKWEDSILLNLIMQYSKTDKAIDQFVSFKNRLSIISDNIEKTPLMQACLSICYLDYNFFAQTFKSLLMDVCNNVNPEESIRENVKTIDNKLKNLEALLNEVSFSFESLQESNRFTFQIQKEIVDRVEILSKIINSESPISPKITRYITAVNDFYKTVRKKINEKISLDLVMPRIQDIYYNFYRKDLYERNDYTFELIQIQDKELNKRLDKFNKIQDYIQDLSLENEENLFLLYHLLDTQLSEIMSTKQPEEDRLSLQSDLGAINHQIIDKIKRIWTTFSDENILRNPLFDSNPQQIEKNFHNEVIEQLLSKDISVLNQESIIQNVKNLYTSDDYLEPKTQLLRAELKFRSHDFISQFREHINLRMNVLFNTLEYYSNLSSFFSGINSKFNLIFAGKKFLNNTPNDFKFSKKIPLMIVKAHIAFFRSVCLNLRSALPQSENDILESKLNFVTSPETILVKVGENLIPLELVSKMFQRVDFLYEIITTTLEYNIREKLKEVINKLILLEKYDLTKAKIEVVNVLIQMLNDPDSFLTTQQPHPIALRISGHMNSECTEHSYRDFDPSVVCQRFKEAITEYYNQALLLISNFKSPEKESLLSLITLEEFKEKLEGLKPIVENIIDHGKGRKRNYKRLS